jgi:hypothetical protein
MISKRVILDQVETTAVGVVQLRFRKEIVEDGRVIGFEYHRTTLEPGIPLPAQMAAVNEHLGRMGWPAVADMSRAQRIVDVEHTPERVAQFKREREERLRQPRV